MCHSGSFNGELCGVWANNSEVTSRRSVPLTSVPGYTSTDIFTTQYVSQTASSHESAVRDNGVPD